MAVVAERRNPMGTSYIPSPDVLADLRATLGFDVARAEAYRTATHADPPPKVCRYCGQHWQPPANTKIDGHARCLVPTAWQGTYAQRVRRNAAMTFAAIGAACGVSMAVARAWYQNGERQAA